MGSCASHYNPKPIHSLLHQEYRLQHMDKFGPSIVCSCKSLDVYGSVPAWTQYLLLHLLRTKGLISICTKSYICLTPSQIFRSICASHLNLEWKTSRRHPSSFCLSEGQRFIPHIQTPSLLNPLAPGPYYQTFQSQTRSSSIRDPAILS